MFEINRNVEISIIEIIRTTYAQHKLVITIFVFIGIGDTERSVTYGLHRIIISLASRHVARTTYWYEIEITQCQIRILTFGYIMVYLRLHQIRAIIYGIDE